VLTWVTAFLDLPAESFDRGVGFWQAVTGYGLSPWRGEFQQFATLVPAEGDAFLRVQRVDDGPARIHLDLHAPDADALADRARALGATEAPSTETPTLASPGGFVFCVVGWHGERNAPAPVRWTHGRRSLVDQVCLDIPPSRFDEECAFWAALTGWARTDGADDEFERLAAPPPVKFLLQRLDDEQPSVTAHLDIGTDHPERGGDGIEAEVTRHLSLGAARRHGGRGWVTLADPSGLEYCVTGHAPG
jgi:hypothetical protein